MKRFASMLRRNWKALLDADTQKTIQRLEPTVNTLYIMTIAVGKVTDIPFAALFFPEGSALKSPAIEADCHTHAAACQIRIC